MTATATMLNKDVFADDVTGNQLRNQGVAKVGAPTTPKEWANLSFELSSFVCDGAYAAGLERILGSFLDNSGRDQPAVWVSGFYGSGKSHFARVLEYVWRDEAFPDGQRARDKVRLPQRIREQLIDLSTGGRQAGGLWAASGLLSAAASEAAGSSAIRLATLGIIFRSAGLPSQYSRARFILWLHQHNRYDTVVERLRQRGFTLDEEVANLHVAEALPEILAELVPSYGSPEGARSAIQAAFPRNVTDISNDDFIEALDATLKLVGTNGKRPLTLIVFDELQQFLNNDGARTLQVQEIVEAVTSRFRGQVLFLATGQAAMNENPNLQKLQGRFSVRVMLQDTDVEHVVREVILRKDPTKVPQLTNVLDRASGEINRQISGTRIAPSHADRDHLVSDYPLLPTRRRFWERLLRDIDTAGTSGQLRTQLRIVQETNRAVAMRPVGTVIGADAIFEQISADMLASSILPPDTNALFAQLDQEPDGDLKGRVARLVFLIGRLGTDGPLASGLTATSDTIGDLLVEDLAHGDTTIRQRLAPVLAQLVDTGALQLIDGHYQIQTAEGREWDVVYNSRANALRNDANRLTDERTSRIQSAVTAQIGKLKVRHGESKTERDTKLFFGPQPPSSAAYGASIPIWIQDEWATPRQSVVNAARQMGQDSEVVFVSIPQVSPDALNEAIVKALAAQETIYQRSGTQSTDNGAQAQSAMESRRKINEATIARIIAETVAGAAVFQGGGSRAQEGGLAASVERAVEASVSRLFTRFAMADHLGWEKVYDRAITGAPDALKAVGWEGDPEKQLVLAEVLKGLGTTGQTGNDVRKRFEDAPYGWPKRAAEAALVVLVAAGQVEATLNGQPQASKQLTSQKLGPVRFTAEETPLSKSELISLRGLVQKFNPDLKTIADELLRVYIPQLLQRAQADAAAAGGQAPLPVPPSTAQITDLLTRTGNDQLKATWEVRKDIEVRIEAWRSARQEIERRLPRWEQLGNMLAHAGSLGSLAHVREQVEAIREQRTLLANPDPVTPLLTTVAEALRSALRTAHADTEAARLREVETLHGTAEWDALTDDQWQRIFQNQGLLPVAEPRMGTDLDLLTTLDHAPLESWETRRQAYPTKVKLAYQIANRMLHPGPGPDPGPGPVPPPPPITVNYSPTHSVMASEADLDAWLATQRQRIALLLSAGKRVAV